MGELSEAVLSGILRFAQHANYKFVTVTPKTHETILQRRPLYSSDLRDIFGWNTCFTMEAIPQELQEILSDPSFLQEYNQTKKSPVRIATFESDLFLHSSYPTTEKDSVFFGPDTYRFLRFVQQTLECSTLPERKRYRILDVGCGSGAGGIIAARALNNQAIELVMNDINPTALAFTRINARQAGIAITTLVGDAFTSVDGNFDLIISNPPFLCDESKRTYRHGGEQLGRDLSVRVTLEFLKHLNPGGKYILYTGVVMTGAIDPFLEEIQPYLDKSECTWTYRELDPDIFGEELEQSIYYEAERIAAVGLVITAPH